MLSHDAFMTVKNKIKYPVLVLVMACVLFHIACSPIKVQKKRSKANLQKTDIINKHYRIADRLLQSVKDNEVFEYPLLVANFVSLENLEQSSPLGRTIPQQIAARLSQLGLKTVDIRLRNSSLLVRQKDGEFGLSRKLKEINKGIQGYAILVGTYSVLYGQIYINARILRSSDALILASVDYTLPLTPRAFPPGQLPEDASQVIHPTVDTKL